MASVSVIGNEVYTNGGSNRATDFCCSNKFANLSLVELPAATAGLLDIAKLASAGLSKCRRDCRCLKRHSAIAYKHPRLDIPQTLPARADDVIK